MEKEKFKELTTSEQVEFVNKKLKSGKKTVTEISVELGYSKGYLSKKLTTAGYELNDTKTAYLLKQVEGQMKIEDVEPQEATGAIESEAAIQEDSQDSKATRETTGELLESSSIEVAQKEQIQKNILELAAHHSEIMAMLEQHRLQQSGKVMHGLVIDKSKFKGKLVPGHHKLYDNVNNMLKKLKKKHNTSTQDLLNQAIMEMYEKYK